MRGWAVIGCCWPGLPGLWRRGNWQGLALALLFGAALNLLLLVRLKGAPVPATLEGAAWLALVVWWLGSAVYAGRAILHPPLATRDHQGLFIQAQGEYLKGHWFEAESLLRRLLQSVSHDVDAHLLLASLCRRTQRYDEAYRRLDLMERLDGADKWRWEMDAEKRLLRRLMESDTQRSET